MQSAKEIGLVPELAGPLASGEFGTATVRALTRTALAAKGTDLELTEGALLLLYTDGLIERRGESIDAGLARLASAVTGDEPDAVLRRVMSELVGSHRPGDDIAVLALRRSST